MTSNESIMHEIDEEIHLVGEDILYIIRLLVAFVFIIVGLIGIIFPIIPDWPLLLVGIVLLDTHGVFRRKIIRKTPKRYKKLLKKVLFFIKMKEKKKG